MTSCIQEFLVRPLWRKPCFRNGYTEYHVVRKMSCRYTGDSKGPYTRETVDVLLKTKNIDEATNFRDELLKRGFK